MTTTITLENKRNNSYGNTFKRPVWDMVRNGEVVGHMSHRQQPFAPWVVSLYSDDAGDFSEFTTKTKAVAFIETL